MPGYTDQPWTKGKTTRGELIIFTETKQPGPYGGLLHARIIAEILPTPDHPERAEFNAQLVAVAPLLDSALRAISNGDRESLKRWMAEHCPERLRPDSENPVIDWQDRVVHVANYCVSRACAIH